VVIVVVVVVAVVVGSAAIARSGVCEVDGRGRGSEEEVGLLAVGLEASEDDEAGSRAIDAMLAWNLWAPTSDVGRRSGWKEVGAELPGTRRGSIYAVAVIMLLRDGAEWETRKWSSSARAGGCGLHKAVGRARQDGSEVCVIMR
jgi:hypothetical protein